jgi:hypothetical protein
MCLTFPEKEQEILTNLNILVEGLLEFVVKSYLSDLPFTQALRMYGDSIRFACREEDMKLPTSAWLFQYLKGYLTGRHYGTSNLSAYLDKKFKGAT